MKKVRKILAPTDLSDLSAVGVRYAMEMARELSAEVLVYRVMPLGEDWVPPRLDSGPVRDLLANETAALEKFLSEKFADELNLVEITKRVEFGAAHSNIVDAAEREGVDMIIMATHGRTGFNHILLGSVAEKVIARATCPVLVIPAGDRKKAAAKAA
ncbi:MAG: universal stress protein [Deltaproteobacteria bacterium]|nr:universal stress protein [Deltaproteobacteria bacterium]MBM4297341.1 universal stress protein [Deltaproteobacteria bacterium]